MRKLALVLITTTVALGVTAVAEAQDPRQAKLEELMGRWERVGAELAALCGAADASTRG